MRAARTGQARRQASPKTKAPKTKAAKPQTATRSRRTKTQDAAPRKAFPLIGRKDLLSLLEQAAMFGNRVATANGSLRELVGDAVKTKHLHPKAFRMVSGLVRMGERDPQALWLLLAHFDDMRTKAGLDRIAKEQGQLLPPITGDDDESETEAQGEAEGEYDDEDDNVINYAREVDERAGDAA